MAPDAQLRSLLTARHFVARDASTRAEIAGHTSHLSGGSHGGNPARADQRGGKSFHASLRRRVPCKYRCLSKFVQNCLILASHSYRDHGGALETPLAGGELNFARPEGSKVVRTFALCSCLLAVVINELVDGHDQQTERGYASRKLSYLSVILLNVHERFDQLELCAQLFLFAALLLQRSSLAVVNANYADIIARG